MEMSGFIGVYNLLKKQGHEFVVITARGGFVKEMKDDAIKLLKENNNINDFRKEEKCSNYIQNISQQATNHKQ